jgi:predicted nucleic acid-binding protein
MRAIPLSRAVADKVIALRSQFSIKLPDAIIAASALTENLPFMTRNTDDFRRIDKLVLVNPFGGT